MIESDLVGHIPGYLASFGAGCLLGAIFLWGLWLTVQRIPQSAHPASLTLVSLGLRFSAALSVFYVIAHFGTWQHLIIAAVGFTLPRLIISRRVLSTVKTREGTHS